MRGMPLIIGLLAVGLGWAWSAETPAAITATPTPAATEHYQFTVGATQVYAYSLKQSVTWSSAGDNLAYTSTLTWKFLLTVVEATPERAVLEATILRVQATHDGPGSRRLIDSSIKDEQDGRDDPLLGHLLALHGSVLTVVVAPATGEVSEVRGGDAIVARINKRSPAAVPGDPPPLDAAARSAFSSEALGRIWNQMLALPTAQPTHVPLGPPLGGEIERTWQGAAFTLRLPAGKERLAATLVGDPTPVAAVLTELTGQGTTSVKGGLPGPGKGDLTFLLTFQALTQPVVQHHSLQWELSPLNAPVTPR